MGKIQTSNALFSTQKGLMLTHVSLVMTFDFLMCEI